MKKLLAFGFHKNKGIYTYSTRILGGQFLMIVMVSDDNVVNTKVIDSSSNEEYILHLISEAKGSFVGALRTEYEGVLTEVAQQCFESDVFKSDYAKKIIKYVTDTYHDELEFLWPCSPQNAIIRRKDSNKWYATMIVLPKRKLGLIDDQKVDILNLKIYPENLDAIIDNKKYFPAYHMNKKHWCTICLDGSVPIREIYKRIDASYAMSSK